MPRHKFARVSDCRLPRSIQVAQTIGTLSLSLRSLADNQSELDQAIASGSVKVPAGANKAQEEKLLSDAMNRPVEGGTTFVTGGDVSRFQRRNVPSAAPAPRAPSAPYSAPAAASPARPAGPVVRVTRGKTTVEEPVGRN